jgi:hypothetical protein
MMITLAERLTSGEYATKKYSFILPEFPDTSRISMIGWTGQ